jgi:hypothetical protein
VLLYSPGLIDVHQRQVLYLLLGDVEPDTIFADSSHGARSG